MNPDIKALLETSHKMVLVERVKHVLAEATHLEWRAKVSPDGFRRSKSQERRERV